MPDNDLLKLYIETVINEDDGGDYGGDYGYGGGGGGYGVGGGVQGLAKIFVEPFTDVLKTGAAVVTDISNKAQVAVGGILATALNSIIPFHEVEFDKIRAESRQKSEQIMKKYADVFERTDKSLFTGDGALMMFLYNPGYYLTAKAVQHSPEVAMELINIIAGQNSVIKNFTDAIGGKIKAFKEKIGLNAKREPADNRGATDMDYGWNESIDAYDQILIEGILDSLTKFFKNKDVADAINSSPKAKQMRQDAKLLIQDRVDMIYNQAKESLNLRSTEKINQLTGGKFSKEMAKIKPEERQKAAAHVANQLKGAIKKFYIDKLKADAKQMPKDLRLYYEETLGRVNKL